MRSDGNDVHAGNSFCGWSDNLNTDRTEITEATTELLAGVQYKLARDVELNQPLTVTASETNGLYVKCELLPVK